MLYGPQGKSLHFCCCLQVALYEGVKGEHSCIVLNPKYPDMISLCHSDAT